MRSFTYHASLARSVSDSSELAIIPYIAATRQNEVASRVKELAAMIHEDQLAPAFNIFGRDTSEALSVGPRIDPNRDIVFDLPPAMTDTPWKIAILLNLLDYGTAPIEGEEEMRFITQAEFSLPNSSGLTLEKLNAELADWNSSALKWLREDVWSGANTEDSQLEQWPESFESAGVEVLMEYNAPLETDADAEALKLIGRDLEALTAWTGLETKAINIDAWNEQMLEYPVTRESTRTSMRYHVEFAPANPASLLRLFTDILEDRYSRNVSKWEIRAYPL